MSEEQNEQPPTMNQIIRGSTRPTPEQRHARVFGLPEPAEPEGDDAA